MSTARQLKVGQKIGEYRLVAFLGAGGMSETWRAQHPQLDKKVVIKVLLPSLAGIPQARGYFSAEGKLGAKLHHSNIVNLMDRGDIPELGTGYIVLELVEGIDLERLLGAQHGLPPEWAIYVGHELLTGLSYVHRAVIDGEPGRVVHRDITPDNVFLSCDAEVKLGDFGIAQVRAMLREKTQIPGQIKGKFKYLSPEMARHEPVDSRADLFQVGLILYEMVTGAAAFSPTSEGVEHIKAGVYRRIPELRKGVPRPLVQFIERLMATQRRDRPATADEALELLEDGTARFYRAHRTRRELAAAVTRLTNLSASTVYSVPDDLRDFLEPTDQHQPSIEARELEAPAIVRAPPDAETLFAGDDTQSQLPSPLLAEARPRTLALPEETPGSPASPEARPPTLALPEEVFEDEETRPAAAEKARGANEPETGPLRLPLQDAPRRLPRWVTAVAAGAVTVLMLGAIALESRRPADPEVAPTPPRPAVARPVAPPVAPAAAPAPVVSPLASPKPAEATTASAARPASATESASASQPVSATPVASTARVASPTPVAGPKSVAPPDARSGTIVVRKEEGLVRAIIDGVPYEAPAHVSATAGLHVVELVHGDPEHEVATRATVKVRAGHRYVVNKPQPEPAHAESDPAAPEPATPEPAAPEPATPEN